MSRQQTFKSNMLRIAVGTPVDCRSPHSTDYDVRGTVEAFVSTPDFHLYGVRLEGGSYRNFSPEYVRVAEAPALPDLLSEPDDDLEEEYTIAHDDRIANVEESERDEPSFTLLGRDPAAFLLVALWRKIKIEMGYLNEEKLDEALACSVSMEQWAEDHGKIVDKAREAFARVMNGHRNGPGSPTGATLTDPEQARKDCGN